MAFNRSSQIHILKTSATLITNLGENKTYFSALKIFLINLLLWLQLSVQSVQSDEREMDSLTL